MVFLFRVLILSEVLLRVPLTTDSASVPLASHVMGFCILQPDGVS